ncbi:MAG: peptidyl-prolyl cis-trans isomerase [Eudoraea sp.]|nr:peptidyl-prolyl cis-trans isomerase [Eudoraea sp.]
MISPLKNLLRVPVLLGSLILVVLVISCDGLFKKESDSEPLARVGDAFLYKEDIETLLSASINQQDSASLVTNYINNWAIKRLLFSKAQINLTEEEIAAFERLVANYRIDLFTRAYKEALVLRGEDTTVTDVQLQRFYEEEKENFILKEKLVQLRFIQLPTQFLNKDEVIEGLQRFGEEDKVFLDSISVQFTKLNFNDSLWIPVSRIIQEIPPITFENEDRYLKKSQFFELEDSVGVYLGKIAEVRSINDIAPLTYIEPTIRQVLLNRRKLEFMRRLETEILDEAVKQNEFEIYEKKK